MNLLRAIASSPWMVSDKYADTYMPLAVRMLQGEQVVFPQADAQPLRAYDLISGKSFSFQEDEDQDMLGNLPAPTKSIVMVYPVKGMITKEDQMCGPRGTETLMRMLKDADKDPAVTGHLLEIDSGGGEATNIETVARTIRGLSKPVVAWFNGMAASAAYYMAAGADEIYAGEETDEVGSIGVLLSFADLRGMYEKEGVKFHEIYAEQSSLKNKDFKEAREGNYEEMQKRFLNPYADRFIRTMQEFRPQLQEDDAYKGQLYMAPEAIEIGMIDGILALEDAARRVYELAKNQQSSQQNSTHMNGFKKLFGTPDAGVTDQPGATQQDAELENLFTQVEAEIKAVSAQIAEMRTTLEQVKADLGGLKTRTSETEAILADLPAAAAARAKSPDAEPPLISSEEADMLAEFEQNIAKTAQNGTHFRIN